jgi:hypothetical protein
MTGMVRGPSGNMLNPGMRVTRIAPALPVQAVRSYDVVSPHETHTRKARCQEVECQHYGRGWQTIVDTATPTGRMQANYIRLHSGRKFTYTETGTVVTFTFPAEQQCFSDHRVPLDRPALYVVRDGDWRGNPSGYRRAHRSADDWVDDFATNQERIARLQERG